MSEAERAQEKQQKAVNSEGLARIPNRDKGSSKSPPFIMMGVFIVFAILSFILASLS